MSKQKQTTNSITLQTCNIISWEPKIADDISRKIQEKRKEITSMNCPLIVSIVGIPGSGKTTSATSLSEILASNHNISNIILPMDGYHYPISTLQQFPNSKDAIYRRGAPDTFDSKSLYNDLHTIISNDQEIVSIPGFDHAKGDPEPNKYIFDRNKHDVIICEGLYLLLLDDDNNNENRWYKNMKSMFDYSVFINADIEKCLSRVKERNKCIPGYTPDEIEVRVDNVDRKNALLVQKCQAYADIVVQSFQCNM